MPSAQKTNINLLPKNEFEKTPIGGFFKWALTFGKYIVIITQLTVIALFLFRFKLDRTIEVLNENISRKQETIVSYQDFELKARSLQEQLSLIKSITKNQVLVNKTLQSMSQAAPLEVEIEKMTFSQDSISIEGSCLSEVGLATLVSKLQNEKSFTDISVDSITAGGSSKAALAFKINFKPTLFSTQEGKNEL